MEAQGCLPYADLCSLHILCKFTHNSHWQFLSSVLQDRRLKADQCPQKQGEPVFWNPPGGPGTISGSICSPQARSKDLDLGTHHLLLLRRQEFGSLYIEDRKSRQSATRKLDRTPCPEPLDVCQGAGCSQPARWTRTGPWLSSAWLWAGEAAEGRIWTLSPLYLPSRGVSYQQVSQLPCACSPWGSHMGP